MNHILFLLVLLFYGVGPVCATAYARCAGGLEPRRLSTLKGHAVAKPGAQAATGRVHALTLFARFADEDSGSDRLPAWTDQIFDAQQPGSLSDYYHEMSGGQFELAGEVVPRWFTARHAASYYVQDEDFAFGTFGDFVVDILDAADPVIDFGRFDNDGPDGMPNSGDDDGYVDFIFVNARSTPYGFIRGPATGIAVLGIHSDYRTGDASAKGGNIRIRKDEHANGIGGITQRASTYAEAVGTMAHEFGHALGLPDLFDLSFHIAEEGGEDDSAGIGYWGLMGHGNRGWQERGRPTPFCAWSLEQLGWIGAANSRLVVVNERLEGARLRDPRDGGLVYRLPSREKQVYYLVEFRSPELSYYDRHLPKAGTLIWRVDESRSTNHDENNKLVDLICADGLYADRAFPRGVEPSPFDGGDNLDFWAHSDTYRETHGGNLGDETDLFDGVLFNEFSAVSNPASGRGISVSKLRMSGDGMLADLDPGDRRWTGSIDGEVVWQDTIELPGDLIVSPGGRLIITPGTVILAGRDQLASGEDPLRSELIVEGDLESGSVSGEPVVFTSAAEGRRPGDWFGIRVLPPGLARIENTRIEFAVSGVHASSPSRSLLLARVWVDQSLANGVVVTGLRTSVIARELEVSRSGDFAMAVSGGGELRVEGSRFVGNARGGILRLGGRLTLMDSDFTDHTVHVLAEKTEGLVQLSRFSGGGIGLRVTESARMEVGGSHFTDLETGVLSESSVLKIRANTFRNVSTAVQVTGTAVPSQLVLNVVEGAQTLLANESELLVRAQHNWWGPPEDGPVEVRMVGEVDWQPRLFTDPRTPASFGLQGSYPNPFNGTATIEYSVGVENVISANDGRMLLEIFDVAGQKVRVLAVLAAASGEFRAVWDGRNDDGLPVSSGVYLYRLQVGQKAESRRLLLLR
ncbi:MAG: immune inhibitor A domain-containing protein [Candidatus Latescibacterota bacterium]